MAFNKFRKWLPWVKRASAALLIEVGIITDIAIQNPSTSPIDFPPTSTVVLGVNEIETGAGEIEH